MPSREAFFGRKDYPRFQKKKLVCMCVSLYKQAPFCLLYMACFWFINHNKMFLTAEEHVHSGIIVEPAVMKGAYMSVSKNSIDSTI